MPLQRADERPEVPRMVPQIVRPLPPKLENVHESQTLHMEAQILPVDDNQLKVNLVSTENSVASSRFRGRRGFRNI